MTSSTFTFTPDPTQQRIIDLQQGRHLVLAPPGCGKTQILSERIHRAHSLGVDYADMLCLTFTNRAARGMRDRIALSLDDDDAAQVFVGNVHRFCARFLFENRLVAQECSVIDDDTVVSILAAYLQEDEQEVMKNKNRRGRYNEIMYFSHLMYEIRQGIARELRLHPECATADDMAAWRAICQLQQREFTAEAMLDIYDHTDFYLDMINGDDIDFALRGSAKSTLMKMRYAHAYEAYKRQNHLLDFEDLLQQTYVALRGDSGMKRYKWIQVDEVQDLNFMQLAIVDLLSTCGTAREGTDGGTILYLGDEQQAIFSFMGAKLQTLNWLKHHCSGHIYHLGVNHRSPRYMVDMLNAFAAQQLHSDPSLLPQPQSDEQAPHDALQIRGSKDIHAEYEDVARLVGELAKGSTDETTAVIVNSNVDADRMSSTLLQQGISHFKVSGEDIFASPAVKLILAHLSVLANERNFLAWSRLFEGLGVCNGAASARRLAHQLEVRGIAPTDAIVYDGSTYLQEFVRAYEDRDIVVFDTETTGLDVFHDDVIQIAAERLRKGKRVAKLSVHITTERAIPTMLGDTPNPIIAERERQALVSPQQALRQFLAFAEGGVLLAHNAEFDYPIMRFYMQRHLPDERWQARFPSYFDSLKIIRLLRPDLKTFKLKHLLDELGLQGENSHLADDDVFATVSLTNYCYAQSKPILARQAEMMSRPGVREQLDRLRRRYGEVYAEGRRQLYLYPQGEADTENPALVREMQRFYAVAKENKWLGEQPRMHYVYRFLARDIIRAGKEPALVEQLQHHIMELNTFKEADLCGMSTMDERVFVSTIHKAKGLEFDNVIVFDVIEGRLPNFYNEGNSKGLAEDARKLYVAMSRAKRRLIITHSEMRTTPYAVRPLRLSRFMDSISHFFTSS